jgi:N-acetylneuraminic acid mutarotase
MPTPRGGIAAAAVGGCLYVFGGEGNQFHPRGIFDQVEVYDPSTDSWQALDPMAAPRHGIGAAVAGSRIYLPGGATVQGFGATAVHQAYDVGGP